MVVYRGFDDGYIVITEDMMSNEERFILGTLKHLGRVVVQRTKEKGGFTFEFRCNVSGFSAPRYGDNTLKVLQATHDAIYGFLWDECGVV